MTTTAYRKFLVLIRQDALTDEELAMLWLMLKQIDESYAFVITANGVRHHMVKKDGAYYVFSDIDPRHGAEVAYEFISNKGLVRGSGFSTQRNIPQSPPRYMYKALRIMYTSLGSVYRVHEDGSCVDQGYYSGVWEKLRLLATEVHLLQCVEDIKSYLSC